MQIKKNFTECTGRILHLDGDKKYGDKARKYYNQLGLHAIVKNIPENKQPFLIKKLLYKYAPDILVITGHDLMFKKNQDYNNIYNYKNSRHFVKTVTNAREYSPSLDDLIIFSGACQSFYEQLIKAGANFASSPGRILIDFMDPIIVAQKVATTANYRYITIQEISYDLKGGLKGIGGTKARGKKKLL